MPLAGLFFRSPEVAVGTKAHPYVARAHNFLPQKRYQDDRYADEAHRSWVFRTVGYGHLLGFWKGLVSTLRLIDYDYVISIEHEDTLMSTDEGVAKAVQFLKGLVIREPRSPMWWD